MGNLIDFAAMTIPIDAYAGDISADMPPIGNVSSRQSTKPQSFPLIAASELTSHPVKIAWLIYNFIEIASLNLLFGEPGAAKSLIALEWAFCIALGLEWRGLATKKTDVVIVAGEGFSGYARRLRALEIKYGITAPANLFVSQRPAQLLDAQSARLVAESIRSACSNPGLVIIDTMHRNADIDENSSQDIGKFINNLDEFLKPLGAAVLIVHHSGHNDKGRSRGSSAIRGALDAEFSATKNDDFITLTCLKSKDFESYRPLNFKLRVVELGWFDDDDEPVTSVYLEPIDKEDVSDKPARLTRLESSILQALDSAIGLHGTEPSEDMKQQNNLGQISGVLVVQLEQWRDFVHQLPVMIEKTTDARRMAFKRSKVKLVESGFVAESDGYVWRVVNDK